MTDLHYLAASAALTWTMLLTASLLRSRGWTPAGMKIAFGNRENLAEPTPIAARADRAAKNMLENLALFTALVAASRLAGAPEGAATLGAAVFFYGRVVYFPVYLAGIPYLRTLVWLVSVVGLVLVGATALG